MIRAILFDLDGTLVDRQAAHRQYCLDLMIRNPDRVVRPDHTIERVHDLWRIVP